MVPKIETFLYHVSTMHFPRIFTHWSCLRHFFKYRPDETLLNKLEQVNAVLPYKSDKIYSVPMVGTSLRIVNLTIEFIREMTVPGVMPVIRQNTSGVGNVNNLTTLDFIFMTHRNYNLYKSRHKIELRKAFNDATNQARSFGCSLLTTECLTAALDEVINEMSVSENKLNITYYDYWHAIEDDYSIALITIEPK